METAGFQYIGADFISFQFRRFGMCYAVNFDDQFSVERYEIDDISIDGVLATKFPPG